MPEWDDRGVCDHKKGETWLNTFQICLFCWFYRLIKVNLLVMLLIHFSSWSNFNPKLHFIKSDFSHSTVQIVQWISVLIQTVLRFGSQWLAFWLVIKMMNQYLLERKWLYQILFRCLIMIQFILFYCTHNVVSLGAEEKNDWS